MTHDPHAEPNGRSREIAVAMRRAFRQLASGVAVVTTSYDGQLYGITVTSLTSISLEPPILMIAINNESPTIAAIAASERFAVHLLAAEQEELSVQFAASVDSAEKFRGVRIDPGPNDSHRLAGALASLDCRVERTVPVGTHSVLFGRVHDAVSARAPGDPLVYFHRRYWRLKTNRDD